jgi:hypothetical protein
MQSSATTQNGVAISTGSVSNSFQAYIDRLYSGSFETLFVDAECSITARLPPVVGQHTKQSNQELCQDHVDQGKD